MVGKGGGKGRGGGGVKGGRGLKDLSSKIFNRKF